MKKNILLIVGFFLFFFVIVTSTKIYELYKEPDAWCGRKHPTMDKLLQSPKIAKDYFTRGNYFYDIGNCEQAVNEYTGAIVLDPSFPQVYNNRAYTYMRLREYKKALVDLDKAIFLNPNYMYAHMNRGDIYNYYFAINRELAVKDYDTVIALGGAHDTSVCGHKAMAQTQNIIPLAFLNFFLRVHWHC